MVFESRWFKIFKDTLFDGPINNYNNEIHGNTFTLKCQT